MIKAKRKSIAISSKISLDMEVGASPITIKSDKQKAKASYYTVKSQLGKVLRIRCDFGLFLHILQPSIIELTSFLL